MGEVYQVKKIVELRLLDRKKQVLYSDAMHIDGRRFLVMVCQPLNLTLQVYIERESPTVLGAALQEHLELLYSRGFVLLRVHVDPQSAFRSLTMKFKNVTIDVGGMADYLPKADAKIK